MADKIQQLIASEGIRERKQVMLALAFFVLGGFCSFLAGAGLGLFLRYGDPLFLALAVLMVVCAIINWRGFTSENGRI